VAMIRTITSGESHGKCLTGIIEGLPSGLAVDTDFIQSQLLRRRMGYGRGRRMQIENDRFEITSGVRHGKTLGSPVTFVIANKDWESWRIAMSPDPVPKAAQGEFTRPRPGHADLAGALKHHTHDARDVLERASARETASRVAIGAICRLLLRQFNIRIGSHVLSIGQASVPAAAESLDFNSILAIDPESALHCADTEAERQMITLIDRAAKEGDTLGGTAEVIATGVPPGLGSYTQWDRKLDAQLALALMSIPAVKAVEIGTGIAAAALTGSCVHDEIHYDVETRRFFRKSNNAGGLEGGVTNGADLRARIYVKPVPTLHRSLMSVDLVTKEACTAAYERSDTCVVPAAGVVAESMVGMVLAQAFLDKFGGDSMIELEANYSNYCDLLDKY
jgi:chorismate synthase